MNRNHLALFHAVAQAGSISGGAQRARVSQPAVSKQIKELEEALGVSLLERLPRGTLLTQAGKILADYAQQMNALEGSAARAIEEFQGLKRGCLAVGASTTIGAYLLPQVFGEFHRRHPEVELQMEIANTKAIQNSLMEGLGEVGLTEGVNETEHFHSEVFHEDELVAIVPRGHPLLKKTSVSARELCNEPLILREEGSGTRAVVERALIKRGLLVNPVLSLASTEAIKRAVIAGVGVAIVSRLTIDCELQFGSLSILQVKDLVIHRPLHLQTIQGRSHSTALGAFLTLLASWKSKPRAK
jgi:molybdate transport repressor ModE-like protein